MKITIKAKKNIFLLFLIGFISINFSCEDDNNESLILNKSVNIESFMINDLEGNINNQTGNINLTLPYGTDISSVSPQVILPKQAKINPFIDGPINLNNTIEYRVINGNLYKDYVVTAQVLKPITNFSINGIDATINNNSKVISLVLANDEIDITNLQPNIQLSEGVSISPNPNTGLDFSNPVIFTVNGNGKTEKYEAVITMPNSGIKVAYLGVSNSMDDISNPDEIAAANWLTSNFQDVTYISFNDIIDGANLDYSVIWWHFDSSMDLPEIAFNEIVINKIRAFYSQGGGLLLSTFAAKYVEALKLVPEGKGPNNVFGDFLPNGFVEKNNSWGISFKTHTEHPIFKELNTFENGKAYFLEKGIFRLNHTAWWFLPEWGGYENGKGWRDQTGGINLASESWDDNLDGRVAIAEFPNNNQGNTIVIGFGAYDWYNENDPDGSTSETNAFLLNIQTLTKNAIEYLSKK
ncbi:DUF4960 domain-containing protein [Zunongwangia sp.]|uniref:DUF4960 domain-containing protein n=1 Tax=Zunongwangia sp. TaxID=1965325 RepID=UPI003AA80C0E